jgi:hypothetical protein
VKSSHEVGELLAADEDAERAAKYRVVYDEAIRALAMQKASFDALRSRVGFLIAAAAIATSFLGGLALDQRELHAGATVAIILFVAFGAVSLRILWPRAEGADGFTATPSLVIDQYLEAGDNQDEEQPLWVIYRDLGLYAEEAHDNNTRAHLAPLSSWFRWGIILLTAEIVVWVVDLAAQ